MVILLSGASHTGKTRLAQQLMEQLHIPYLSIDHLKMGLIRSGQTTLTPTDDRQLTVYLWSIVREMVQTVIENHQNLIVEGCYIPFHCKDDFSSQSLLCFSNVSLSVRLGFLLITAGVFLRMHLSQESKERCTIKLLWMR